MRQIGVSAARSRFGDLLRLVEQGEVIVITRRGRPAARLVLELPPPNRSDALEAASRIQLRAAAAKGVFFDWDEWKAFKDEGRP